MTVAGHTPGGSPRPHGDREPREPGGDGIRGGDDRPAEFRYGAVFIVVLVLLVFLVVAPSADWSRAVGLALEGGALLVAVAPPARARLSAAGEPLRERWPRWWWSSR
jgi:hypothetical protein